MVKNQFLQDYVQRMGQKLASMPEAKQSGFDFTFTVLSVGEINAFALPGGPMFIYTGLLKTCENEAQLAGVMGHEMSHVILRHGTHEASKANAIQLAFGGAGALFGGGGESTGGRLAQVGLGIFGNSVILKFSRDAETEADALGSHLMSEAGYDPIQMAKFFEKLAAGGSQGSQFLSQFLSDHPNPGNRETAIVAEMRTLPARTCNADSGQFARVKKEVAALPPPAKKPGANAIAPGSSVPSAGSAPEGYKRYQGQGYSMIYPDSWLVNSGGGDVTIAPRDGVTQQGVGFGVLIGTFTPRRGRTTLSAATADLIKRLQGDNPKMRVSQASRDATVADAAAMITMLAEDSPFGGGETDQLVTVLRQNALLYFVFVAPDADFARVQKTFDQMLASIQ